MHQKPELEELYDRGLAHKEIAVRMNMTKASVAREVAIIRMQRGEIMGDVDPAWVKRRYLDEGATREELAKELKVSTSQLSRFLTAHAIGRDPGLRIRLGLAEPWNKGLSAETSPIYKRMSEERSGAGNPMFGREAWNLGLTKETDGRVAAMAAANKGRTMSAEARKKMAAAKTGKLREASNRWNGGHLSNNYVAVGGGFHREYLHREIAKKLLKRDLDVAEHVHHIDEDKKNNVPENLLVLDTGDHTRLHQAMRLSLGLDQRAWLIENGISFIDLASLKEEA